jgi:hypothetical protein
MEIAILEKEMTFFLPNALYTLKYNVLSLVHYVCTRARVSVVQKAFERTK